MNGKSPDLKQLDYFPRLKPGVKFFNTSKDIQIGQCPEFSTYPEFCTYVGFAHRGVELSDPSASSLLNLLKKLNGSKSLGEIYDAMEIISESSCPTDQIIAILSEAQLIEFNKIASVDLTNSKFAPVNLVNSKNRIRAEENLVSWSSYLGTENSVAELISERSSFSIIIFGQNRLALSLFSILQASGFTQSKLIDRSISPDQASKIAISPDQVCGLAIRGSDIGVQKALVIADLARNSALFTSTEISFPAQPDFIISTQPIPQDTRQRWMSEEIPHLAISNLIENKITIGPIVIPGKSPCLNCLDLWRIEQYPHFAEFELLTALENSEVISLELPAAQVALISGLVAIAVVEFCASFSTKLKIDFWQSLELVGGTLEIDLLNPIPARTVRTVKNEIGGNEIGGNEIGKFSKYRYWQPHISCGCQRLI